jgi:hypothetical protein
VGHLRDGDGFIGDDQESIPVSCGSNGLVTATAAKNFSKRTLRDLVTGGGLTGETVVVAMNGATSATLSKSCSGSQTLTFRHDHRNYAVSFTVTVPYTAP